MAARSKRKASAPKMETFEAVSTVVGQAFTMPELAAAALAETEREPLDFQAKQDSISSTRRTPGPKLAPKVKRTAAKPSNAKETKVKI